MGARKRVARFLKAWEKGSPDNLILRYLPQGKTVKLGKEAGLYVSDLGDLINDSRDYKQLLKDDKGLQEENAWLVEQVIRLEHESAPELPELADDVGLVTEELRLTQAKAAKLEMQISEAWAAVPMLDRNIGGLAASITAVTSLHIDRIRELEAENERLTTAVAQRNAAETQWAENEEQLRIRLRIAQRAEDREQAAWLAIPKSYRHRSDGLAAAVKLLADTDGERGEQLADVEALVPSGYRNGTLAERVKAWMGNYVKRIEQLNATIQRLREQEQKLRVQLIEARNKVAPERNGKGPDGASNLARWVQAYRTTQPGGHGRLHSINADVPTYLDVSDIEATLRQLNEARALADRRHELLQQASKARTELNDIRSDLLPSEFDSPANTVYVCLENWKRSLDSPGGLLRSMLARIVEEKLEELT